MLRVAIPVQLIQFLTLNSQQELKLPSRTFLWLIASSGKSPLWHSQRVGPWKMQSHTAAVPCTLPFHVTRSIFLLLLKSHCNTEPNSCSHLLQRRMRNEEIWVIVSTLLQSNWASLSKWLLYPSVSSSMKWSVWMSNKLLYKLESFLLLSFCVEFIFLVIIVFQLWSSFYCWALFFLLS